MGLRDTTQRSSAMSFESPGPPIRGFQLFRATSWTSSPKKFPGRMLTDFEGVGKRCRYEKLSTVRNGKAGLKVAARKDRSRKAVTVDCGEA
jgi:hypothetical protein